jgi:hypothetical protein
MVPMPACFVLRIPRRAHSFQCKPSDGPGLDCQEAVTLRGLSAPFGRLIADSVEKGRLTISRAQNGG